MEKVLQPKLRFPGYEEEWEVVKFNDLYDFKSTNSLSRDKLNYEVFNVKNIHYGDIHVKFKTIFDVNKEHVPFINSDVDLSRIKDDSYVREGDVIIADASENYEDIGKSIEVININNERIISGLHTFLARRISNKNYLGYNSYYFQTNNYRHQVYKIAQGTKVLSLSSNRVAQLNIQLPSLPEQQNIADYLTTIDRKIELLEEKKTELTRYKKAMMQKLFSQEIRFKDENGNDFADWEEKRLGEVLFHVSKRNKNNSIQNVLSVSNTKGFISQGEQFENHRVASKDVTNYKVVSLGEFAYNPSRINIGSIALLKNFKEGIVSPMYVVFKVKEELNREFFNYLTKLKSFNDNIKKWSSGSVRETLNYEDLVLFKYSIPSLTEQQKIAKFLSAIDESIDKVSDQLAETQRFKKAMLQQMFV
ncbi:type I restriction-modification protein subunit S [Sphingobacterium mizutaii NBRC 14946 = DSM 11724]|uniref:EcoKI restriction-modification system protein HsdS n=2 Tax=Sphingobacterium mizutaii TaxID=1010 RepID=A0AAJ5C010_9SPHI|nr:restriction endonuclease subunit S [Sphingobacterium mizutaii]GEM67167.1 type I restriction-modification protein subunit S [Sphingobacterium mizutaii NBRC 14946 = DSM 11724]SDK98073.1 type I restriction enzyme, S subunit [Sphingobacterium mizutaii]SNV49337.1 EcoKI restriction-modification system protein HsdS [Sphingobacterium mizutaii]